MSSRLCSCAIMCIASGLWSPAVSFADAPNSTATGKPTVSSWIVTQTNAVRRELLLAELKTSPALERAAQSLADEMARTGQLSHEADGRTPAERVVAEQYRWRFVAENIAYRSEVEPTEEATARLLLEQWRNSPGHRRNLLAPEPIEIGAATARGSDGSIYAVQVFAAPLTP